MNVPLIEVSKKEAVEKLLKYKSLTQKQKTAEDERLRSLYQAVSKGARVINVANAFKVSGLNELGQPKLALARADQKTIWFHPRQTFDGWRNAGGCGGFSPYQWWHSTHTALNYALPLNTFDNEKLTSRALKSSVPHIPPKIRPTILLNNFHILFEVEKWFEYPVDPYLLRRIYGHLFIVVAEWELTELEASLLSSMR